MAKIYAVHADTRHLCYVTQVRIRINPLRRRDGPGFRHNPTPGSCS